MRTPGTRTPRLVLHPFCNACPFVPERTRPGPAAAHLPDLQSRDLQHYYCEEPLLHDWFHFTGDLIPLFEKLGIPFNGPFRPAAWQFITETVREMEIEHFAGMPEHEHLLHLKTEELFIRLSRALQDKFFLEINGTDSEKLRRLRSKIVIQLGRRWTVREMADEVSLSESRFFSLYKAVYGTSPMDDLILARIDAAKNSLLFTDLSIGDIAETLGYSNASHFSRQFRSQTGISPLQYRKNGRKTE